MQALQAACQLTTNAEIRFAALCFALDAEPSGQLHQLCRRYRVPTHYHQLANLVAHHHLTAFRAKALNDEALLQLLSHLDIFRRSERFDNFLTACAAVVAP